MFLFKVIISLFVITISFYSVLSLATPTDDAQNSVSNATESVQKLEKICDLCTCQGTILNCTNQAVTKKFTDYEWPAKLTEALFIKSKIENVSVFPAVEINKLVITKNDVKNIHPETFKEINGLRELDLSDNNLTSSILLPDDFVGKFSPEDLEPLPDLILLDLSNNLLESLDSDLFTHTRGMRKLILQNNPLKDIVDKTTSALVTLINLEDLDLSGCQLKELHLKLEYMIKKLKILNLSNNLFEKPPTILEIAESLETLILDSNPFTVVDKTNAFRKMLKLTTLRMNNMPKLLKIEAGSLSNLPSLQNLSIAHCPKFFYISGEALKNHNNTRANDPLLNKLNLSNNSLQHLPLKLTMWDKIEQLHLINNQWSCDCNNELIGSFLATYGIKLLKDELNLLECFNPPELKGHKLATLDHTRLRCLNFYDASEGRNEAAFLVGLLIGLLIAIPMILAIIVFWRKGYFICGSKPASYSRAFYKRTASTEDYY